MRVLISPEVLSRKLANGPINFVDSDSVNGNLFDNSTQDHILVAWNTDAGVQTIETPKRHTVDGDADVPDPLSLTAGQIYAFDWFENTYYGWNDVDNALNNRNAVIINTSSNNIKLALLPRGDRATLIG